MPALLFRDGSVAYGSLRRVQALVDLSQRDLIIGIDLTAVDGSCLRILDHASQALETAI